MSLLRNVLSYDNMHEMCYHMITCMHNTALHMCALAPCADSLKYRWCKTCADLHTNIMLVSNCSESQPCTLAN